MFSGLWPRNISYCAPDEPPRPDIKTNSEPARAGEAGEGYTNKTEGGEE